MKQVMQDLSRGTTFVLDAPAPQAGRGRLVINSTASLVSAGTERMLMEFGKGSLLAKARQQPDKVKQVLQKVGTDGLLTTLDAVRSKLAQPIPLGYSNVGRVAQVGEGVSGFAPGDRVVSNGSHAETVSVGKNLCALVPDGVSDEAAAFTVVASIGLQGIRLAQPQLGETVAVIGAGIIGLLTVQMLRASGCRVLAVDTNAERLALAEKFGAVPCNPAAGGDPVASGLAISGHKQGVDAVIITASTKSNDVVSQAARMSRKRGRIVLVGVVGLELDRSEFFEKELTFQVSCSYGPGRYDPEYESAGHDYPLGFVRWTEQRNFQAVLDMMESGAIVVDDLVTHRFPVEEVEAAYSALGSDSNALGILLLYSSPAAARSGSRISFPRAAAPPLPANGVVGCIGAGNFASRTMLPALKRAGAGLHTIVAPSGVPAAVEAGKAGFAHASSVVQDVFANPEIDTAFILTRHSSHAGLAAQALRAGKHVFVEKPLSVDTAGLEEVRAAVAESPGRLLMVGFNRRFAPLAGDLRRALSGVAEPSTLIITVNAGVLPSSHWTLSPAEGGRIIGEGCHFIDFARYLVGHPIEQVEAVGLAAAPGTHGSGDTACVSLGFRDGSLATINYFSNGSSAFPKERVEIFNGGRTLQLENFISLTPYGWKSVKARKLWKQDKGHNACVAAFLAAVRAGQSSPIPLDEIFEVHEATFEAARQLAAPRRNAAG
jgi:predicted dehydrogenase